MPAIPPSSLHPHPAGGTRYGFLSTFPPTRCGLATFTDELATAIATPTDPRPEVVRVLDDLRSDTTGRIGAGARVVAEVRAGDARSIRAAITALDAMDVAIVQHEYGIYGGPDGEEVLAILDGLHVPTIVVLHTVLDAPSAHQKDVLERVVAAADATVVMTETARSLLAAHYRVDLSRVDVVPHGVPEWMAAPVIDTPTPAERGSDLPSLLTWGLIGPGKGLQWGIRAVALLRDEGLDLRYVIAGQTHPKVLENDGESYRDSLRTLAADLGVLDRVDLDDRYLAPSQLAGLVRSADVVLLPYDSRNQVTSGVLVEAIAAGRPVVATAFPHALDLLSRPDDRSGVLVRHEDPESMAAGIRTVLERADPIARATAPVALGDASWSSVAERYRVLVGRLRTARAA